MKVRKDHFRNFEDFGDNFKQQMLFHISLRKYWSCGLRKLRTFAYQTISNNISISRFFILLTFSLFSFSMLS
jgi:hypothetical protein